MFSVPENNRVKGDPGHNYGAFVLPRAKNWFLYCIASEGLEWEHVSAHAFKVKKLLNNRKRISVRTPEWREICAIKDVFWDPTDTVVQYHPPKREYINCHPHVLHLWRPIKGEVLRPPQILVGPPMERELERDKTVELPKAV